MDSSTAEGTRNRTSFVTEETAGMGPDPGREVHISPPGFSQQATERNNITGEQFNYKWRHRPIAFKSQDSLREFSGGGGG